MFAAPAALSSKYILIQSIRDEDSIDCGGGDHWVNVKNPGDELVLATKPNYITDVLLPTFHNYDPKRDIDPQFVKDFERAEPCAGRKRYAQRWLCNSECMERNAIRALRKVRRWNACYMSIITALFNQRVGIDLCRRVFTISGSSCMVLPDNNSFTLDLRLPPSLTCPSIVAHAKVSIHAYTEKGLLVQPEKDRVCIYGHYNLDTGQVLYVLKRPCEQMSILA
jgi:hypothetical protein|tara:strand:+ start:980 stop:1648 length:669 start_codon:yes stop_codon:yes gene_type:complete